MTLLNILPTLDLSFLDSSLACCSVLFVLFAFIYCIVKFPFGKKEHTYDIYVPEGVTEVEIVDVDERLFERLHPAEPTITTEDTDKEIILTYLGRGEKGCYYRYQTKIKPGHNLKPVFSRLDNQKLKVDLEKDYTSFCMGLLGIAIGAGVLWLFLNLIHYWSTS